MQPEVMILLLLLALVTSKTQRRSCGYVTPLELSHITTTRAILIVRRLALSEFRLSTGSLPKLPLQKDYSMWSTSKA